VLIHPSQQHAKGDHDANPRLRNNGLQGRSAGKLVKEVLAANHNSTLNQ
jgi:hypothetical protein